MTALISKRFEKFDDLLSAIIIDFPDFSKINIIQYPNISGLPDMSNLFQGLLIDGSHWYFMMTHDWFEEIRWSRIHEDYAPICDIQKYNEGYDIKVILTNKQREIIQDILE